ncbi:hypothetical protein LCGC14_2419320, partial [marine sediment metagenome]
MILDVVSHKSNLPVGLIPRETRIVTIAAPARPSAKFPIQPDFLRRSRGRSPSTAPLAPVRISKVRGPILGTNPVVSINIRNPEENPYRKKGKLEYRLDLINPNLSTRINEISKSISIISKMKHLNDTAHQMREFLSHFLQLCDPNNDVKNTSWVEFSKNGNIIQKSRAIYAIIGS